MRNLKLNQSFNKGAILRIFHLFSLKEILISPLPWALAFFQRLRSILLGWFRKAGRADRDAWTGHAPWGSRKAVCPSAIWFRRGRIHLLVSEGALLLTALGSLREKPGVGLEGNSSPALGSQESQVTGLCAELELLEEAISVGVGKYGESPKKR